MNYLHTMCIYKSAEAGDSNVYCINNRTSTESLTLEDLKKMINTVDLIFSSLPTHETYLTINYGESIFHNHDAIQAYYRLFDRVESTHQPKPSHIWMTQSPCLVCAKRLISEYGKQDSIKPTLHIASIYSGNDLLDTVDSMKCMAKMVHLNFTVLPWDWTDFRDNIDHSDCIDSIDSALQDPGFGDKRRQLQSLTDFIHELSSNPEVSSWCSLWERHTRAHKNYHHETTLSLCSHYTCLLYHLYHCAFRM